MRLPDTKPHGLPIRFSNLAVPVVGPRGGDQLADTLGSAVADIASAGPFRRGLASLLGKNKEGRKNWIAGVEGVLDQGQLLLIVGNERAKILLHALSCSIDFPVSETTLLDFGLLPSSAFAKSSPFSLSSSAGSLREQLVFLNEHDVHFATLSLRESLMPAARAKTPSPALRKRLSRASWAAKAFAEVVASLGLNHAVDTPVGSPLVRGLSGGERKRASVAEALLTRGAVLLLQQPTNGLDSSTAGSLLGLLKSWTKAGSRTLVATAPSLSDPLYCVFDRVLVLSSRGGQVYFGPASDAETYFTALGLGFRRRLEVGEGVAEFLVACVERADDLELERAWRSSAARSALLQEMAAYDSKYPFATCAGPLLEAIQEEKSTWTRPSSHFTVSFARQVAIVTRRQLALILSELPTYTAKTVVNLALSTLVGTLFFALPPTTSAAFTRGSLLFLSVMFNCYLCLAELGKALEGREIVRRQADFGLLSSSALALARVVGDLPLIGAQVLLFGTITYSLVGLQRSLEHFAIFLLFLYATALNLSSMFRLFAAVSPNFDVAIRYCGVALNVLVVLAGYFIPTASIRPWLRWIQLVLDPVSRSFEAVLSNEFRSLNLTCSPSDIVPSGPSYADPRYQTCLLPGSTPGSLTVSGSRYLATAYDFHHHPGRNLAILLLQALVFLLLSVIATELFHFAPEGQKRLWARTERVKKRLTAKWYKIPGEEGLMGASTLTDADAEASALGEEAEPIPGIEGRTLTWHDVSLWIDTRLETRRLLHRISGFISPGELTALIGKTGAGKSTLLNVLAGRTEGAAVIKGEILVDGSAPGSEFYRTTGYVEQFDLHDEHSTVREALEFSAILRQDSRIPKAEKLAYVNVVLDLLDLTHLQDAIVGTPTAGLSLEQRKKVAIAVEVVSRPSVLFLDEPTTGLDTKSAFRIVKLLGRLAHAGLAVIATIHQPTAEAFRCFDRVLVLQPGGKQVFFGKREEAVEFFPNESAKNYANSADFLLVAAGAGVAVADADPPSPFDSLAARWATSPQAQTLFFTINSLNAHGASIDRSATYSASVFRQSVELTRRVSRGYYRDASFGYTKLFTAVVVPLIIGLAFFQLGNSIVSMQNRLFAVFLILFVPPVFMNLGIFKTFRLRSLWHARERPSRVYGATAFASSLLASEIPWSLGCGTIFFCIWYFLVGLPLQASTMSYAFGLVQLFFFFQSTWAVWIVALSPSLGTVANLLPFFLVSLECFNGSLMPYSQMPQYWKWLYWISPFQWYVRGMLGVLLHNQEVECAPIELSSFAPPPGQSCQEYAAVYLHSNPGYLTNPTSDSLCHFCKFSSGDDFLAQLNISHSDRWVAFGIFAAYTASNVLLVYLLTLFPPKMPRWGCRWKGRAEVEAEEAERRERVGGTEDPERLAGGVIDAFA